MTNGTDMGAEHAPQNNRAPSIGRVGGLDYDHAGERVKGIVDRPFTPLGLVMELQKAEQIAKDNAASRRTIRTVIPSDRLSQAARAAEMKGFSVEGEMFLNHHLAGLEIVYFGKNDPMRNPRTEIREAEEASIEAILQRPLKSPAEVIVKAQQDYVLERLTEATPEDHADLVAMYKHSFSEYPFSIEETIFDMIKSPDTQVYVARSKKDGRLHAVCATEQVEVSLPDGRRIIVREMGDSARSPEGNGLNAPLKLMLIEEASREGVDLIYCESRANHPAVNAINHSIGMDFAGYLPAHTRIAGKIDSDIPQDGPFGDLNVWSLNREKMDVIAQQVRMALQS